MRTSNFLLLRMLKQRRLAAYTIMIFKIFHLVFDCVALRTNSSTGCQGIGFDDDNVPAVENSWASPLAAFTVQFTPFIRPPHAATNSVSYWKWKNSIGLREDESALLDWTFMKILSSKSSFPHQKKFVTVLNQSYYSYGSCSYPKNIMKSTFGIINIFSQPQRNAEINGILFSRTMGIFHLWLFFTFILSYDEFHKTFPNKKLCHLEVIPRMI